MGELLGVEGDGQGAGRSVAEGLGGVAGEARRQIDRHQGRRRGFGPAQGLGADGVKAFGQARAEQRVDDQFGAVDAGRGHPHHLAGPGLGGEGGVAFQL